MKFSTLLSAGLGLLALAAATAAALDLGTGLATDGWTYLAVFAHLALLLVLSQVGRRRRDGLLLLLVAAAFLAHAQSMVALLWDLTAFNLYRLRAPIPDEFTRAVWWASAGTLALALGILLAGRPLGPRPMSPGGPARPLLVRAQGFMLGLTAVVLLLNLLLTATTGVGTAGAVGGGGRLAALANLFSRDLGMLMVLIVAVRHWRVVSPRVQRATIGVVLLYLAVTVFQGSRGGLLLIVVMAMVAMVVEHGDFFMPRRVLMGMLIAAVVTGLVIWPLATGIRTERVVDATGTVVTPVAPLPGGSAAVGAITFLKPIAERQGRMAQLIAVSNDWVPGARNEVRAIGMLLNTVAGLFPGPNPDPELYPLIGRSYAVIYLQSPRDQVFAEEWSPVALMLLFLPSWLALLALLGWGWGTGVLLQLMRSWQTGYGHVLRVNFAYNLVFSMFAGAVIDVLAPQFIRWAVLAGVALASFVVLEQLSAAAFRRPGTLLRFGDVS